MAHDKGGRPTKQEIKERREKVKTLLLQGKTINSIANTLGTSYPTVQKDAEYIHAVYARMTLNNKEIARKQYAEVTKLLDEVSIIKQEYWDLYTDIKNKAVESEKKYAEWEAKVKQVEVDLQVAKAMGDKAKIRELIDKYRDIKREPKYPTYITSRIDALKSILERIDKEAKLLGMFNPQNFIQENYVSIKVLSSIMEIFKTIIMDLIPVDKRKYAFQRLKTIDIDTLDAKEVMDEKVGLRKD